MTFFNKKEDVIKIELTPYGRRSLLKGKFKPTYYTFLDDNILYNSEYAGFSENSVVAKDRILSNTPYMRPQTNYKGVESSINSEASKLSDNFRDDNITEVDNFDDFKEVLENKGGFISAYWDGSDETENKIKDLTKATIRCIPESDNNPGKCVFSGKPSLQRVLFAKAY